MSNEQQFGVAIRHRAYNKLADQWERSRDCFEGQDAIKARHRKYLPPLDSHVVKGEAKRYEAYLMRALFYNAFGRTVVGLSGFVMQKEPQVRDFDKKLEEDLKDVTMEGEGFSAFSLKTLREILITGRYGILVDRTKAVEGDDVLGSRPYWSSYRAENIISWKTERRGNDPSVLVRVVLREEVEKQDPKDEFKLDVVTQYRELVLDPLFGYYQRLWQKPTKQDSNVVASDKWEVQEVVIPERFGAPLDFIPFVPIGATSLSIVPEKPPLLDLADLNLSHYRTSADLEHGRHFTALPTPWFAGLQEDDAALEIGSGVAIILDVGGKAGMLEFTGAGLESLQHADSDKAKKMAVLGARLLEGQSDVGETATAILMRHAGEGATLRSVVSINEQAFTRVLQIHTYWSKPSEKDVKKVKVTVEFNKDFFAIKLNPQEVQALVSALQAEAISYETFYHDLASGGWARPGVTAKEEQAQIAREGGGSDLNDGLDDGKPKFKPGEKPGEKDEGEDDGGDEE